MTKEGNFFVIRGSNAASHHQIEPLSGYLSTIRWKFGLKLIPIFLNMALLALNADMLSKLREN